MLMVTWHQFFFRWQQLDLSVVLFAVGLGFYRANFVQFGLDQLLEAPSKSLALFIHWGMWDERLGMLVIQIFLLVLLCKVKSQPNCMFHFVPYYTSSDDCFSTNHFMLSA